MLNLKSSPEAMCICITLKASQFEMRKEFFRTDKMCFGNSKAYFYNKTKLVNITTPASIFILK